jgi:hypothetical protein
VTLVGLTLAAASYQAQPQRIIEPLDLHVGLKQDGPTAEFEGGTRLIRVTMEPLQSVFSYEVRLRNSYCVAQVLTSVRH